MLGGNAQASDGDIRTQPVGYRGVLSLSQGEHEDTVEDRENRQHKCVVFYRIGKFRRTGYYEVVRGGAEQQEGTEPRL